MTSRWRKLHFHASQQTMQPSQLYQVMDKGNRTHIVGAHVCVSPGASVVSPCDPQFLLATRSRSGELSSPDNLQQLLEGSASDGLER